MCGQHWNKPGSITREQIICQSRKFNLFASLDQSLDQVEPNEKFIAMLWDYSNEFSRTYTTRRFNNMKLVLCPRFGVQDTKGFQME